MTRERRCATGPGHDTHLFAEVVKDPHGLPGQERGQRRSTAQYAVSSAATNHKGKDLDSTMPHAGTPVDTRHPFPLYLFLPVDGRMMELDPALKVVQLDRLLSKNPVCLFGHRRGAGIFILARPQ